jgi:hypothetical protein
MKMKVYPALHITQIKVKIQRFIAVVQFTVTVTVRSTEMRITHTLT